MKRKVVLAYSGGLDTSCCLRWLKDRKFDVICFSANLGSEFSPAALKKKALRGKASKIYIKDLRKEFAEEYILPALKAGAVYEGKYLLSTALGRPLIARHLVDIARKEGATFISHGCSAKGNDQVRLDTAVNILEPRLKIIAPLREWNLTSRRSEIDYARKNNIPVEASKEKIYSIDKNIWGVSIEGGALEDLSNEPREDVFILSRSLKDTPRRPEYVEIGFEKGKPVKLNKSKLSMVAMIERLNRIGGRHGIGRTDLIEDRVVGIKSREIYEAPAAWILHTALRELESLVLSGKSLQLKRLIGTEYANLTYQGLWFSHLKGALDAFADKLACRASGAITLRLYKGNITIAGRHSKNSIYKKELATYGEKDEFNRNWAEGFINIWSMPFRG